MSKRKKRNKLSLNSIPAEYFFVLLGTIFGLFFVFTNPPWQTNDEDRHFIHTYYLSQGQFLPEQGDNKIGGVIPVNIVEIPRRFQGIRFSEEVKISKMKLEEAKNIPLNERNSQFHHNHHYTQPPFSYIPGAIGIAIGQLINSNPVWLNWFGRIGNLFFYILIIFFAIRITPIFKNVFFLYALTPMLIYQGSSVTYDGMNISLTFLLIGVVLKYALDENAFISMRELLWIIALLLLHRFSKGGYPLIPFLFFLIPLRKFKLPFNTLFALVGMLIFCSVLYYIPQWTWSKFISSLGLHLENPIQLQKDLIGNADKSLSFQLQNPGHAVSNLLNNMNYFRQEWGGGIIGRFGYSYTLLPNWFFFIHGLILISVAFFESKKEIIIKPYQKLIAITIALGSIFGIIFMNFLYSPVGANMIFGLQGRYFVNAIPILLLVVYNNKFENISWKKWGVIAIAIYIIISLSYTLNYLDNIFYSIP